MLSAKTADQTAEKYDQFLGEALRATAFLVNRFGYDSSNSFHREAEDWIVQSSVSENIEVAAMAIWALGDLGIPPLSVRDQLKQLIESAPRKGPGQPDHPNTCRAIAFRMLARIDRESAYRYIDSPACREFQEALSCWMDEYPENINRRRELYSETEWLRNT